jgi:hypothetical protein
METIVIALLTLGVLGLIRSNDREDHEKKMTQAGFCQAVAEGRKVWTRCPEPACPTKETKR